MKKYWLVIAAIFLFLPVGVAQSSAELLGFNTQTAYRNNLSNMFTAGVNNTGAESLTIKPRIDILDEEGEIVETLQIRSKTLPPHTYSTFAHTWDTDNYSIYRARLAVQYDGSWLNKTKNLTTAAVQSEEPAPYISGTPEFIEMRFKDTSFPKNSTIEFRGLHPNTDYFIFHGDGVNGQEFTTSASGTATYTGTIPAQHIWIQPEPMGTLNVTSDTTLTSDLNESVIIGDDDVELDCDGHLINDSGSVGVLINNKRNVTVKNCRITRFGTAIKVAGSEEIRLVNNTVLSPFTDGIRLLDSRSNKLLNNTINGSAELSVFRQGGETLAVFGGDGGRFNIVLRRTNSTVVEGNKLSQSVEGVRALVADNNTITDNTFVGHQEHAVLGGNDNVLADNNFTLTTTEAIIMPGLFVSFVGEKTSARNRIVNNTIGPTGLFFNIGFGGDNNVIAGNEMLNTFGVALISINSASGNVVRDNVVTDHFGTGISLNRNVFSNPGEVDNNTLANNSLEFGEFSSNPVGQFETTDGTVLNDGINVETASNTTIRNNTMFGRGIDVIFSNGTRAERNTVRKSLAGINMTFSDTNRVVDNFLRDNKQGIVLRESEGSAIRSNDIGSDRIQLNKVNLSEVSANTGHNVVSLDDSFRNTITNDFVAGRIVLRDSDGNTIRSNSPVNKIDLLRSDDNTIFSNDPDNRIRLDTSRDNNITANTVPNIALIQASFSTVRNNSAGDISVSTSSIVSMSENSAGSIRLSNAVDNTIVDNPDVNRIRLTDAHANTVARNTVGKQILLEQARRNDVLSNNVSNTGTDGIVLQQSNRTQVEQNRVVDAANGISLSNAFRNTIADNTALNNEFGILLDNSQLNSIHNNTANTNAKDGIHFNRSLFNNITKNSANNNTDDGVHVVVSNNTDALNNTIKNNSVGLHISDSTNVTWEDNEFDNTGPNVLIDPPRFLLAINNVVENGETGIEMIDAINGRIISDVIRNNSIGVELNNTQNITFFNSTITNSSTFDVVLDNASAELVNTSFNNSKVEVLGTSRFPVRWFLDVRVVNTTGGVVENATVVGVDRQGTEAFSKVTGSKGRIPRQLLTEFVQNATGRTFFSPYTLTTTKEGFAINERVVNLTKSKSVVITLQRQLVVPANINIDPDTLQLKSEGRWITTYIEVPGHNVSKINISSVELNKTVPAVDNPKFGFVSDPEIKDRDNDTLPELMVKFDRCSVQNIVPIKDSVLLNVTGDIGQFVFQGNDSIRVLGEEADRDERCPPITTAESNGQVSASIYQAGPGVHEFNFSGRGTGITEIETGLAENVSFSSLTVEETATNGPQTPYNGFEVQTRNFNGAIRNASFGFRVATDWLEERNVDPGSVVLWRLNETAGVWEQLPTERVDETNALTGLFVKAASLFKNLLFVDAGGAEAEYVYYRADSPGFSLFRVAGESETTTSSSSDTDADDGGGSGGSSIDIPSTQDDETAEEEESPGTDAEESETTEESEEGDSVERRPASPAESGDGQENNRENRGAGEEDLRQVVLSPVVAALVAAALLGGIVLLRRRR